jgi:hypothetical protein
MDPGSLLSPEDLTGSAEALLLQVVWRMFGAVYALSQNPGCLQAALSASRCHA